MKRAPFVLCFLVIAATYIAVIWQSPILFTGVAEDESLSTKERLEAYSRIRQSAAQVGAGGLAILIAAFAYLRFRAVDEQNRISESGQISERFNEAVKLLSSNEEEQQLGGVYSLKSIAQSHREWHATCLEVLTAFARSKSAIAMEEIMDLSRSLSTGDQTYPEEVTEVSAPIHAVAKFLRTRNKRWRKTEEPIDLSRTRLVQVNLSECDLPGASLTYADLKQANLKGAELCGANLQHADLRGADIRDANLSDAFRPEDDLSGQGWRIDGNMRLQQRAK